LQLTLDLFRELQFSLQPRLHMEIGLIRLVEAGKLLPIEQALASLGQPGGFSPSGPPPKSAAPSLFGGETPVSPAPMAAGLPPGADWKQRLRAAFLEMGMTYSADAIEHSQVVESAGELHFSVPKEFALSMKPEEIQKAIQHVGGGKRKIKIAFTEVVPAQAKPGEAPQQPPESEEEAARRALSHPEVRRFREVFPDAEVRTVRNLKE
jgi:DNA polymerase-3 subunit gamma/tau